MTNKQTKSPRPWHQTQSVKEKKSSDLGVADRLGVVLFFEALC